MQEEAKRGDEMPSMRNIMPPNGRAHLVHQHVPDLFRSAHALKKRCAEHDCDRLSDVLVLGNGVDLIRCEIAKADQVYERDHVSLLYGHCWGALLVRLKDHSRHGVTVRSEQRPM